MGCVRRQGLGTGLWPAPFQGTGSAVPLGVTWGWGRFHSMPWIPVVADPSFRCSVLAPIQRLGASWKDLCSREMESEPQAETSSGWIMKGLHPASQMCGSEGLRLPGWPQTEAGWSSGQSPGSEGVLLPESGLTSDRL